MKRSISLILLFGILILPNLVVNAQNNNNGCDISAFTISPDETSYNRGVSLELFGSSTCDAVRFEVDGIARAEISSTQQYATLQTSELGIGSHYICFEARGRGGWHNANRSCKSVIVRGTIEIDDINFSTCPTDFARVAIGDEVTVSDYNNALLPFRELPGTDQTRIGSIPVNTELTILNGPVCATNWRWWQVEYNNQYGWVGEVGPERLFNLNPPQCAPHYISLEVGDRVQVTEGPANRVRSDAGLEFPYSDTVEHGTPLRIIDGPVCRDGFWWWKIRYSGNETGWTAEGDVEENWLESYP